MVGPLDVAAALAKAAREFGNYGAVAIGVQRATGRARVEVGDPNLQSFDFEQGNLFANVTVDRLDSLYFPRDGYYAELGYRPVAGYGVYACSPGAVFLGKDLDAGQGMDGAPWAS